MLEQNLNVLLITPALNFGGEEISTIDLATGLSKKGHNIFYMSSGGPLLERIQKLDIHYLEGPVNKRNFLGVLNASLAIRRIILEKRIDIIHAQQVFPAIMGWLASRSTSGRPQVIWHDRGINLNRYSLVAKSFNFFADFVITNSEWERQLLIKNGLSGKKVKTIYNGFNWAVYGKGIDHKEANYEFGLNPDIPKVGIIARLDPDKGHKYFLQAACQILKVIPSARFLIIGGGPLEGELKKIASDFGIAEAVIFTGFVKEISKAIAILDVIVLPSTREPFGRVLVEAGAMGKPAVATKVGGIPEIIEDGKTGFLVSPGDTETLAQRILELLNNRELAREMGTNAERRVKQRFSLERMVNEIEEVYIYLLDGRRRYWR